MPLFSRLPSALPSVDAFTLDLGVLARAVRRGVHVGPLPPSEAAAPGEVRKIRVPHDRTVLDTVMARDPHSGEYLESVASLLMHRLDGRNKPKG